MTVDPLAEVGIDAVLHPVGVVGSTIGFLNDEGHLPAMAFARGGRVWVAQAGLLQIAGPAFAQSTLEEELVVSVFVLVFAAQPHRFARRAGAGLGYRIERKRARRDHGLRGFRLPRGRRAGAVGGFVVRELWVTRAKLIIGDIPIDPIVMQILHVGFIRITGVGGHDGAVLVEIVTNSQALVTRLNGV